MPSECDVVVVLVHSRLGTALPARFSQDEGTRAVTGTEWEYEDAMKGNQGTGSPEVLVYRRTSPVMRDLAATSPVELGEAARQVDLVRAFFDRMVAAQRGYNTYERTDQFADIVSGHLKSILRRRLDGGTIRDRIVSWVSGGPPDGIDFRDLISFACRATEEPQLRVLGIERLRNEVADINDARRGQLVELALATMAAPVAEVAKEGTRLANRLVRVGWMPISSLRVAAENPRWEVQSHVVAVLKNHDANEVIEVLDGIPSTLDYWRPVQTISEILCERAPGLSDGDRKCALEVVRRLLSNPGQSSGQVKRLQRTLLLLDDPATNVSSAAIRTALMVEEP